MPRAEETRVGVGEKAGYVLRAVGCSGWSATVVCADNTVVISMRACDRGKSEALGTRSAEGVPCEGWLVVHVRGLTLTEPNKTVNFFYLHGTNFVHEGLRHCCPPDHISHIT